MQDLFVIRNGNVIVQCDGYSYTDSLDNFILDGGISLPDGIESIDYNKTLGTCWINGEAFKAFPNEYAERVISSVSSLCEKFEARKKIREETERVEREEAEQIKREQEEAERLANMTEEEKNAQIQAQLTAAVQNVLDSEAQKLNYDSCLSVCSYVDTGVTKFDDEGKAFRAWRSAVWAKGYEILNAVLAGEREIPTEEELLAELPALAIVYSE
jgi:hypothetical protein